MTVFQTVVRMTVPQTVRMTAPQTAVCTTAPQTAACTTAPQTVVRMTAPPDSSVYEKVRMLKPDVSDRKAHIHTGYCKSTSQRIPFYALILITAVVKSVLPTPFRT